MWTNYITDAGRTERPEVVPGGREGGLWIRIGPDALSLDWEAAEALEHALAAALEEHARQEAAAKNAQPEAA